MRFSQLVDGVDNQAPHIGAPIANALGAVAHILQSRGENEEAIARFEAALELLTRAADPVGTTRTTIVSVGASVGTTTTMPAA